LRQIYRDEPVEAIKVACWRFVNCILYQTIISKCGGGGYILTIAEAMSQN